MHREKTDLLRDTLQQVKKPLSITEISRLSNLSRVTTARYLDQMHLSGQVKMYEIGRAKKFILSSEHSYTHLCDLASPFVLILDQYLRVVFVNDSFLKFSKMVRDDIIGKQIDALHLDIFSSPDIIRLLRHTHHEGIEHHHVTCQVHDTYHVYSITRAKISFSHQYIATAIIAEDITEKHKHEEKIQFLASIVSSSDDGIIGVDLNGSVISWNGGAEKIFKISASDVIGHHISSIFPPDKKTRFSEVLDRVMTGKVAGLKDTAQIPQHDRLVDISYTISPIKSDSDEIIGLSLIIRDISDFAATQRALFSSKKKLHILSSITRHDILNQLQALDAFTDLLEAFVQDPQGHEYLEYIRTCSTTIRQHIQFTREYQEIGDNIPIWQNIERLVRATVVDWLPASVHLTIQTEGYEILSDPMLMLALYNLVENSLRHGKRVTEMSIVLIPHHTGGGRLIFEDNGIGVPASKKSIIFEKGYGENTGLGLFLVREILAITGLSIEETGEENKGARFEITIPAHALRRTTHQSEMQRQI